MPQHQTALSSDLTYYQNVNNASVSYIHSDSVKSLRFSSVRRSAFYPTDALFTLIASQVRDCQGRGDRELTLAIIFYSASIILYSGKIISYLACMLLLKYVPS